MVAEVDAATALVVTVNGALVAPAGTVTLPGTVAAAVLSLDSVTCAPPAGAGPPSVAVPVAVLPPVTLVGLTASDARPAAAVPVRAAGPDTPLESAGKGAEDGARTALVGSLIGALE